jgi:hypothetical protein
MCDSVYGECHPKTIDECNGTAGSNGNVVYCKQGNNPKTGDCKKKMDDTFVDKYTCKVRSPGMDTGNAYFEWDKDNNQ